MYCRQCGTSNDDAAKFCAKCGKPLAQSPYQAPATGAADAPSDDEFYKAVIGPKNQVRYLSYFSRFDAASGVGVSWHWPAFFVSFYWLLYRKMWLYALLYFFAPYLLLFLFGIIAGVSGADAFIGVGYFVWLAGVLIVIPMYANALYYRHCRKIITEVKTSSSEPQRQLGELAAKGGTSGIVGIIVLIFVLIAVLGILAAIAIPAYQDYTVRARIAEALVFGADAKDSVAQYYTEHQEAPGSLEQAGFTAAPPPSVKAIGVNPQNGTITITLAIRPIEGTSIVLVPSVNQDKQITWMCMSGDIKDLYLPFACRKPK